MQYTLADACRSHPDARRTVSARLWVLSFLGICKLPFDCCRALAMARHAIGHERYHCRTIECAHAGTTYVGIAIDIAPPATQTDSLDLYYSRTSQLQASNVQLYLLDYLIQLYLAKSKMLSVLEFQKLSFLLPCPPTLGS